MYAAASGMAAQQTNLEIEADNLANADVAGYKSVTVSFADVHAGDALGLGTTTLGRHAVFAQGKLMKSGGPFDIAIDGVGFFCVEKNGVRAYTRAGEFSRAPDGTIRNAAGWRLSGVHIAGDALAVNVAADGRVFIDTLATSHREVARIELASFSSPEGLHALDGTLFTATDTSGPPHHFPPGGEGHPTIAFGMLEKANVSIVESMMAIMTAQRAYEANAKPPMKCCGSPIISTDPNPTAVVRDTLQAVLFAEIMKPLAAVLGPVGDLAIDSVAQSVFVRTPR
jgi:flagellar basal-body rod protein FlgG